ncbi:MAG: flagellar biosynthesis anti-sigma factor FlgM [Deltaproteobacteria bacterium]|nr:flagellar biosynthesis anti-sigma factor FlgM [Deltaproteobacteria bacterium]
MNSKRESEKLAKQLNNLRARKISKLKSRIVAGKYHVSNMDLAKALFLAR